MIRDKFWKQMNKDRLELRKNQRNQLRKKNKRKRNLIRKKKNQNDK